MGNIMATGRERGGERVCEMQDVRKRDMVEYGEERKASETETSAAVVGGDEKVAVFEDSAR